jgi:hypothetical protein
MWWVGSACVGGGPTTGKRFRRRRRVFDSRNGGGPVTTPRRSSPSPVLSACVREVSGVVLNVTVDGGFLTLYPD